LTAPRLRRPVLLYDRGCRFCRFAARVVARLDRRDELAFLPLDDPEAAALLAGVTETERLETWRLASPGGSLTGRGTGGVDLLLALRLTRPAGRLLAHVPGHRLDQAYEAIARRRGTLGRLVPDRPGPRRFP
jgi:predicted DCC family thiol-disulfide oxidoreductase YuxK